MTPAQGLRLSLVPYPSSFRMGFVPPSEAPLSALQLPALPFLVVHVEAAGLRGSGIHPLFFPASGYASMPTCFALAPVLKLSLVLGPISFWMGFAPYLRILFAPCGCRRAYCCLHCAHESDRVLASLLGSSPFMGQSPISRLLLGWDPVGVAHSFHPSLLLGGVLVLFCSGPC